MLLRAASEDRLYGLYAVALSLGLRRGEALELRCSDADLDEDGCCGCVRRCSGWRVGWFRAT